MEADLETQQTSCIGVQLFLWN